MVGCREAEEMRREGDEWSGLVDGKGGQGRAGAKELVGLAAAVACSAPMPTPVHSAARAVRVDVVRTVAEAVDDTTVASASVFDQVTIAVTASTLPNRLPPRSIPLPPHSRIGRS